MVISSKPKKKKRSREEQKQALLWEVNSPMRTSPLEILINLITKIISEGKEGTLLERKGKEKVPTQNRYY